MLLQSIENLLFFISQENPQHSKDQMYILWTVKGNIILDFSLVD